MNFPDYVLGIDTSFYNRIVDWLRAYEDGVRFAGIRWGQRKDWPDSYTQISWPDAKFAGLARFAYYVWDEQDGHNSNDHTEGVLNVAHSLGTNRYNGELPFAVDVELEPLTWSELRLFLLWLERWTKRKPIIYIGSWFIERVVPLPDWLNEYDYWVPVYNDVGPALWGAFKDVDPNIVCWQQSNCWRVAWVSNAGVDRNYWIKSYGSYLMTERYVKESELLAWVDENAIIIEEEPPPPVDGFELGSPLTDLASQRLTQDFNMNYQWYKSIGGHDGLDWGIPVGTLIMASHDGDVTVSGYRPGRDDDPYGDHVRLKTIAKDHNGIARTYTTIYAHLSRLDVAIGDHVKKGDAVGLSGGVGSRAGNSSGPHLHFGVKCAGAQGRGETFLNYDFVNPWIWLKHWNLETLQRRKTITGLRIRNHPTIVGTITRRIMNPDVIFPVYAIVNNWGAHDISHTAWSSLNNRYSRQV